MSGHSKWATIKHKKGAQDKARGKLFAKLIRQVEVAAREGGGDPDSNPTLRTMFQKARDNSVPLDTIERAIKRGTGELEGVEYEEVGLEGYGPGGVALYIEVVTDNRNRAVADVRHLLTRHGGSMGEAGSVAWMFTAKGSLVVAVGGRGEEQMMEAAAGAGAEDLSIEGEQASVVTAPGDLGAVREALEAAGFQVESAHLVRVPQSTVPVAGREAEQLLRLLDALEELDDVQHVFANFDIPDEILQAHGS